MNQGFKLKFNQMKEGDPTQSEAPHADHAPSHELYYNDDGIGRNICLVWLDGKRVSRNYAYLVGMEFVPENNTITLEFTTQSFTLTGINLEALFYEIFTQRIKQIVCADKRYNVVGENERWIVNDIICQNTSG